MASLSDPERQQFIRTFFKLRDLSFTQLARQHDVAPSTLSAIAGGRGRSERLETAIAQAIGLSHEQLWPERRSSVIRRENAMT